MSASKFASFMAIVILAGLIAGGGVYLSQRASSRPTSAPPLPSLSQTPVDAATLAGQPGLYYLDASHLTGTLSTDRFSAYQDLVAEQKIPDGSTIITDKSLPASPPAATQTAITGITAGLGLVGGGTAGKLSLAVLPGDGLVFTDGKLTAILGSTVDLTREVTNVLPISNGGTGQTAVPINGQLLIGNGSGYTLSTLTAGPGLAITNNAGAITLTATTSAYVPPQDLDASASPTFAALTLTAAINQLTFGSVTQGQLTWSPTANRLITLPDASGTICLSTGNCPTSGITGSGTVGYLAKFSGNTTLTRGLIYDDGVHLGINTTSPDAFMTIKGNYSWGNSGETFLDAYDSNGTPMINLGSYSGGPQITLGSGVYFNTNGISVGSDGQTIGVWTGGHNNLYLGGGSDSGVGISFQITNGGGEKMKLLSNGNLGVNVAQPTAELQVQGDHNIALTGTVAVTNGSATVTGTGTSFTTQLNSGDALLMGGATYTIASIASNTSLTLSANYAGSAAFGLTAYKDPTLFQVDTGAGTNVLTLTKSGWLGLGISAPIAPVDIEHSSASLPALLVKNLGGGDLLDLWGSGGALSAYVSQYGNYFGGGMWATQNTNFICLQACGASALQLGGSAMIGSTAAPKSELDVAGGVSLGSYAGTAAAPNNGLIVSGAVGIGTANPNASLDLETPQAISSGSVTMTTNYQNAVTLSSAMTIYPGDYLVPSVDTTKGRHVVTVSGTSLTVDQWYNTGIGPETFTIYRPLIKAYDQTLNIPGLMATAGGFVGVGTAAPIAPLSVVNTAGTSGVIATFGDGVGTRLTISGANSEAAEISSGGTIRMDTTGGKGIIIQGYPNFGRVGIGNICNCGTGLEASPPTAQLDIRGAWDTQLAGTFTFTNGTATVSTSADQTSALNPGDVLANQYGLAGTVASVTSTTVTLTTIYNNGNITNGAGYTDPPLLSADNGAGANQLTLSKSGYLGLGTSAPGSRLEINDVSNTATSTALKITSPNNFTGNWFNLGTGNGSASIQLGAIANSPYFDPKITVGNGSAAAALVIGNSQGNIRLLVNNDNTTYIQTDRNNLMFSGWNGGQGQVLTFNYQVSNFTGPLEIGGSNEGALTIASDTAPGNGSSLPNGGLALGTVTGSGGYSWLQSYGNLPLILNSLGNNVGIGTTSPNSPLQVKGAIATAVTSKTAAYTLTAADSVVLADATTASFNLTLPDATTAAGRQYTIKRTNAGTNTPTIVTTNSQTIDGASTYVFSAQNEAITIISDGANWQVIGKK